MEGWVSPSGLRPHSPTKGGETLIQEQVESTKPVAG
jgi:hypothetical protein